MKKLIIIALLLLHPHLEARPNWQPPTNDHKDLVILVHGFARGKSAMWSMSWKLRRAGYTVHRVDYHSLTQNINQIKKDVFKQIDKRIAKTDNIIHFVGHSLGGLLVRAYLDGHTVHKLGRVVTLGSPAKGTPVVDRYKNRWWFKLAGPTALQLAQVDSDFINSLKAPTYELGVIAGSKEGGPFKEALTGDDDGLVQVEATKVDGMADFRLVKANHMGLRHKDEVVEQTIYFLKNGQFMPLHDDQTPRTLD